MKKLFLSFLGISMMTLSFSAFAKKCESGQVTFHFKMPSDNAKVREILYYLVHVKGSGMYGWRQFYEFPFDAPYSPHDGEYLGYKVTWFKKCSLKREMGVVFRCNSDTVCSRTEFQQDNSGQYNFDIDLSQDCADYKCYR